MNAIKLDPIKYVKLFSVLYLFFSVLYAVIMLLYQLPFFLQYGQENFYFSFVRLCFYFELFAPIVQIVLFIIYINRYYGTGKTRIFLLLSYVVSAVNGCFQIILRPNILILLHIAVSIFFAVDSFFNFRYIKYSEKLILISCGISVVSILLVRSSFFLPYYLLTQILLYVAFIIFWCFAVKRQQYYFIERSLASLKRKYTRGKISEDEFTQSKTDLLSQLE